MSSLSPAQAGQIATQGRRMLRRRAITAHQYALLDVVLWAARRPGSAVLTASYKVLARLAGQARSTVAEGIRRLEELGLLQRVRRRIRVAWLGAAVASRQLANAYRLVPPDTESATRPVREQPLIISVVEAPDADRQTALHALDKVRRAREVMRWPK
jgi:DNA-binding Lrp family transcriptional regulator